MYDGGIIFLGVVNWFLIKFEICFIVGSIVDLFKGIELRFLNKNEDMVILEYGLGERFYCVYEGTYS